MTDKAGQEADRQARINHERYKSLMEFTDEGFYLHETKEPIPVDMSLDDQVRELYAGTIVECNDALARMYGFSRREEVLGRTLADFHGSTDNPDNIAFLKFWIESGYKISGAVSEEKDRDGKTIWFSNALNGVVKDGKLIGTWGTQIDITMLKEAEAELRRHKEDLEELVAERTADLQRTLERLKVAQSQLVQSEKMAALGVLAAGVAHEINNPIAYLSSSAITVQRKVAELVDHIGASTRLSSATESEPSGEADVAALAAKCQAIGRGLPELSSNIVEGGRRVTEIVQGLRLFSRVDRNTPELTDLCEGLDSTLMLLGNRTQDRIRLDTDYGKLPQTACYPGKLNQVFMNLVVNAIDALEESGTDDGQIVVRARVEEQDGNPWISISIIDNGPGFSQGVLEHALEPFYTTKPVGHGTGLGLSISHGIVQEHGGELVAANEPGGGARVTVLLPVRKSPPDEVRDV